MRGWARWSSVCLVAAGLACQAQEDQAAGGEESERAAALREASEALRTLAQTQSAEITRMEAVLKTPPDLKAAREAQLKKLQDEAANPATSAARRTQILEVEIPKEKKESLADGNLKELKRQHELAVAERKATQEKLAELQTQLEQAKAESKPKAEGQPAPKVEKKAPADAESKPAP